MYQLRCTKKAQNALGLKAVDLSEPKYENFVLGNWYVNNFTDNRRKCLLFMEEKTLASFVLVGLRKEHIKDIGKIFKNGVVQLLELENFPLEVVFAFKNAPEHVVFTKTASKKLLGNMNDLMSLYRHFIYNEGGVTNCDLCAISMKLNRTPQRSLNWRFSIDAVHETLGTVT